MISGSKKHNRQTLERHRAPPQEQRGNDCPLLGSNDRYCEGLRMPAHEGGAARTGAGVRKPPMEETAGCVAR